MLVRSKNKRKIWMAAGLIASSIVLLYVFVFVYETPGGISDWRLSRAWGLESTVRIPLSHTPEEAVQQMRGSGTFQVIHREPIEGGKLLFMKRTDKQDGSDLQVEYIRKTWFGWKWGWGGGYVIGESKSPTQTKNALTYMSIPTVEHISSPFPMVFGDVLDSAIKNVTIQTKDKDEYKAKLIHTTKESTIWFVLLPTTQSTPLEIKGFSEENELIAHKTITDPRDNGTIEAIH
ncbi:hypothetical protein MHH52_01425 [Paenibacillus sp. FSL K6-0276]|uniref:hypothetical protein n=1 Tax=Paenibacillus sp. FSL K6-0276 TaxID=2921450 RepID=UPI0030EE343C